MVRVSGLRLFRGTLEMEAETGGGRQRNSSDGYLARGKNQQHRRENKIVASKSCRELEKKAMQLERQVFALSQEKKENVERLLDLEILVSINPAIIYRLDCEGNITFISSEVKALLGYTPEKLYGKHISEIIIPEDHDKIRRLTEMRTGTRATKGLEVRLKRQNNAPIFSIVNWVTINASGVYEDGYIGDGRAESRGQCKSDFVGTQGTILDITQRKKAEQELEKAHDQMESIFNNLEEMLFSVDTKNHQLLLISESCIEITGYKREEFYKDNQLWFKIAHPEDKAIIESAYPKLYRGELTRCEYRVLRKNGEIRWVSSKIKPRIDKEGNLVYFDGFVSDITERKKIEDVLHENEYRFREKGVSISLHWIQDVVVGDISSYHLTTEA